MDAQKKQLLDKIQAAENILVTVSSNPSVDQLAAAIGLSLMLNKLDKHATSVFSGDVPSTMEFLKPEKTLEKDTNSLRDFIIALDKSKADKLRYKVEDKVVKIFITPYRTSISQDDLDFSQGDFNVDLVIALAVSEQKDLDQAIVSHGRILHDATVATLSNGDESHLGSINWRDTNASGVSEMVSSMAKDLGKNVLDGQVATSLLTGIVAVTDRFRNEHTSASTMSVSAELMKAGANQQLVTSELEHRLNVHDEGKNQKPADVQTGGNNPPKPKHENGEIEITHDGDIMSEDADKSEESPDLPPALEPKPQHELPEIKQVRSNPDQDRMATPYFGQPAFSAAMDMNKPYDDGFGESVVDPLSAPRPTGGLLNHDHKTIEDKPEKKLPVPLPDEPSVNEPEPNSDQVALPAAKPWEPSDDDQSVKELLGEKKEEPTVDLPKPIDSEPPALPPMPQFGPVPPMPMPPTPAQPAMPGPVAASTPPSPPTPPASFAEPSIIAPEPKTPAVPDMPTFAPPTPTVPPPTPPSPPVPPVSPSAPAPGQSLADLEQSVKAGEALPPAPPVPAAVTPSPTKDVDAARAEVMRALSEQPNDQNVPPIMALNAQPLGEDLHPNNTAANPPVPPSPTLPGAPGAAQQPPLPASPADQPLDMPMPQPGLNVPPPQSQPPTDGPGPSLPPPPPGPPPMTPPSQF